MLVSSTIHSTWSSPRVSSRWPPEISLELLIQCSRLQQDRTNLRHLDTDASQNNPKASMTTQTPGSATNNRRGNNIFPITKNKIVKNKSHPNRTAVKSSHKVAGERISVFRRG